MGKRSCNAKILSSPRLSQQAYLFIEIVGSFAVSTFGHVDCGIESSVRKRYRSLIKTTKAVSGAKVT
jgi:hypothetical protein